MKNLLKIAAAFFLLATESTFAGAFQNIELRARVVSESGKPVSAADVVAYFGHSVGIGVTRSGVTDSAGAVRLKGRSDLEVYVRADAPGFYRSEETISLSRFREVRSDEESPHLTLVLRRIRNPVPMYANARCLLPIKVLNCPVGFDFVAGDWVAPYGTGTVTDVSMEVSGVFSSFADHDSKLTITFPNKGDGLIRFEAHSQSRFRSPHHAEVDGYTPLKVLRKSTAFSGKPNSLKRNRDESVDDTDPAANYMYRIRTTLDEEERVKTALYGKIYGDFDFGGATTNEPYNKIHFAYYLNPTTNSLNIEFDVHANLVRGLPPASRVKMP